MKNKVFLEKLNQLTQDKYNYLRIASHKLYEDGINFRLTFTIPYSIYNSDDFNLESKAEIQKACEEIIPDSIKLHIEYNSLDLSEAVIKRFITDYIMSEYSKLLDGRYQLDKAEIKLQNNITSIILPIEDSMCNYCQNKGFLEGLIEYLKEKIWTDVTVSILPIKIDREIEIKKSTPTLLIDDGIVVMTRKEFIIGEKVSDYPYYISKYSAPRANVTVCGRVIAYEKKVSKANKLFYVLTIEDPTGKMDCIYFSRGKKKSSFDFVHLNTEVYLNGELKRSDFNKKLVLFIRSAYKAEVDFKKTEEKINYLKSQEQKMKVPMPSVYVEKQERAYTLLDEQPYIAPLLREKEFVVFDLETTGLSPITSEICEIGACKISHGQIVSTFQTLIDPKIPMPLEASAVNHITDDMLKKAPTIEYVMQPFLDYCKNATLVGHNALRFDCPFVQNKAEKLGYNFNFECIDTMNLFKDYRPNTKYSNLAYCLKEFNLTNDEAHRALADAIATAKLFIKLCNELKI